MTKYRLNYSNIDAASGAVAEYLLQEGVDGKEVQRQRLSLEEILLKYYNCFGTDAYFALHMTKRFQTLRIEMTVAGLCVDPFAQDADESGSIFNSLLANMGLAPVWRYKNGQNIITFTAKRKKKISQVAALGIAIAAALGLGSLCRVFPADVSDFINNQVVNPVFNTFMGLLSAIAGPVIFLSVIWGICGIGDMATFGKVGKKMISRFLIISFIVGIAGTGICLLFFKMSKEGGADFAFSTLYEMILDIVPKNIIAPFAEGNSLQIIFMAVAVGLAVLFLGNRIPVVLNFFEQLNMVTQVIMGAISRFIPFFVFGSVLNMVVSNQLKEVARSYKLLLVLLLGELILMAAYLPVVAIRKKVSPGNILRKTMPTFLICLTTASSAAAYQTNTETCRNELGIDRKIVDIGIPLGQVVFMPGASIMFLTVVFAMAENYGVAITPVWAVTAMIIAVVLAIAAPPVPGAAITCYTIMFMQLGIPVDVISVAIALNVILEFIATAVNVFCLQLELVELAGVLQVLDIGKLRKKCASRNNHKNK